MLKWKLNRFILALLLTSATSANAASVSVNVAEEMVDANLSPLGTGNIAFSFSSSPIQFPTYQFYFAAGSAITIQNINFHIPNIQNGVVSGTAIVSSCTTSAFTTLNMNYTSPTSYSLQMHGLSCLYNGVNAPNLNLSFTPGQVTIGAPDGTVALTSAEFNATRTTCLGDINGDGVVTFADLLVLAQNYGHTGPGVSGDLNGDNTVNFADLLILAQNYGKTCPSPISIN